MRKQSGLLGVMAVLLLGMFSPLLADAVPHEESVRRAKELWATMLGERSISGEKGDPAWVNLVRRGKDPGEEACQVYMRYDAGRSLKDYYFSPDTEAPNLVTLDELGSSVTPEDFAGAFRNVALTTAGKLLALVELKEGGADVERECGRSDDSFSLHKRREVVEHIIYILASLPAKPEDIKTTPEKLREILVIGIQEEVNALKGYFQNSTEVRQEVKNLLDKYNLTAREVGLNEQEAEMLEEK